MDQASITAAGAIEKVFGFLIAAIAVQLVLDGLHQVGLTGPIPH